MVHLSKSEDIMDQEQAKKHKSKKERKEDKAKLPKKEKKKKKKIELVDSDGDTENVSNGACLSDSAFGSDESMKHETTAEDEEHIQKPKDVSQAEKDGNFNNFEISKTTQKKLKERNVTYLFPIQAKTFNHIYEGSDLIAQARTGTGKTLAFAIPTVEKLHALNHSATKKPKVLVMVPTRELAIQVGNDFKSITDTLKITCIYGGASIDKQRTEIYSGVDVISGTPGRILDFVERGTLDLSQLHFVILDEVDRMLDMGFSETVDDILKTAYSEDRKSDNPQTLLFSATLPVWVTQTAKKYMKEDKKQVDLVGHEGIRTATTVQHLAIKCGYHDRASAIGDVLKVYSGNQGRAMVFCQTKRDADELATSTCIKQETHVLHGDIPQDKREMVLQKFREGRYKCLVTTDVAARGLDIPEVDLVIQCNPPKDVDSYIHRSGRTGRAGRMGTCVCFYKPQEDYALQTVERIAGVKFKKISPPNTDEIIKAAASDAAKALEVIPEQTLDHFRQAAQNLIASRGAENALAAALAVISGSETIESRSLINAKEGYTTFLFRTNKSVERLSYFWTALGRKIPHEAKEKIHHMRMCKDYQGCAFDMPNELASVIDDHWSNGMYDSLDRATELPELIETLGNRSSFGGNNRGSSFGGRGGRGFGGRGGGRGQGFKRSWGESNGQSDSSDRPSKFARSNYNNRGRGTSRGNRGFNRGFNFSNGTSNTNSKKTFDD